MSNIGRKLIPVNRDLERLTRTLSNGIRIEVESLDSPNYEEPVNESFGVKRDDDDDWDDDDEEYTTNSYSDEVSFIEFAIVNAFLHDCFKGKQKQVNVSAYGVTDSIGRITFGGGFDITSSYWFSCKLDDDDNEYIFQTKMFIDGRNELVNQINITCKKGIVHDKLMDLFKKLKSLAFNNSEYKGKCIKVKLREGRFRGIEIIDIKESSNELILNEVQTKFIEHFIVKHITGI